MEPAAFPGNARPCGDTWFGGTSRPHAQPTVIRINLVCDIRHRLPMLLVRFVKKTKYSLNFNRGQPHDGFMDALSSQRDLDSYLTTVESAGAGIGCTFSVGSEGQNGNSG
jgi:hypothetical protein